jgi:DNA-directed RNA polymerase subunit E'/Rpb7
MFFVVSLVRNLLITPDKLGKNLEQHIRDLLSRSVEGSYSVQYGCIIAVLSINEIGGGMV